jgi:hypothetical protein
VTNPFLRNTATCDLSWTLTVKLLFFNVLRQKLAPMVVQILYINLLNRGLIFPRNTAKHILKLVRQIRKSFDLPLRELSFNIQKLSFNIVKKFEDFGSVLMIDFIFDHDLFLDLVLSHSKQRFVSFRKNSIYDLLNVVGLSRFKEVFKFW